MHEVQENKIEHSTPGFYGPFYRWCGLSRKHIACNQCFGWT